MSAFHQVVFTGRLRPGVNAEQAARDFAAVFKLPEEKAWRLILDAREHVLKREVDDANAQRYREVLEEIGLEVRIEPAGTPLGGAAPADDQPDAQRPPADTRSAGPAPVGSSPRPVAAEHGSGTSSGTSSGADNPYAPPQADLTQALDDDGPMAGPQSLPAGHGWLWIKDAYALFRGRPFVWMGVYLVINTMSLVLNWIPLGSLVWFFIAPILAGGVMAGARQFDRQGVARVGMVFDGFSERGGQLALIAVFYLIGILLVALALGLVVAAGVGVTGSSLELMLEDDPTALPAMLGVTWVLLLLLLFFALIVPLVMAYWFAPALVMLEGLDALPAMQASFRACWLNIMPFLVFGLAVLGLSLVFAVVLSVAVGIPVAMASGVAALFSGSALGFAAATPFGLLAFVLGLALILAAVAIMSLAQYTGYRDIFRHAG